MIKLPYKRFLRHGFCEYLIIGLFFLLLIAFVVYFVLQENYIYFWDEANYFKKFQNIDTFLSSSRKSPSSLIISSIRKEDYNILPVIFLLPFRLIFGGERLNYILSIVITYAFPTIILFFMLMKASLTPTLETIGKRGLYCLAILLSFIPQFWIPILRGSVDIVGFLVITLLLLLTLKMLRKNKAYYFVVSGLLLSFLVILRRWYAYWAVSYLIVFGGGLAVAHLLTSSFKIKTYLAVIRNLLLMFVSGSAVFSVLAMPLAKKMLLFDYKYVYSAYKQTASGYQALLVNLEYIGPFYTVFFLAGTATAILNKKTRLFSLFLVLHLITTWLLFTNTQDFSPHHYYLIIPTVIFFITVFVTTALAYLKTTFLKASFITILALIYLLSFGVVFVPAMSTQLSSINFLFPQVRTLPLVRKDIHEIDRILENLDKLVKNKNGFVYVLSNSDILNDDILRNRCFSEHQTLEVCKKILRTNHVDKRDGFPAQFLSSKYVVITNPTGYHLNPKIKESLAFSPNNLIKSNT